MIPLEHEFEAVCAVGCWRRGVAIQRPLWCWRAQRRYLETRAAGRATQLHRARSARRSRQGTLASREHSHVTLRLATRDGVPIESVRR